MMKIMCSYFFSEHPNRPDKNLNLCAQFSGGDRYKLFCGPMFVLGLILTLLDPGEIPPVSCFFSDNSLMY